MKNTARSKDQVEVKKAKLATVNSRVFLPSSQCRGERSHYLFAFGAEI